MTEKLTWDAIKQKYPDEWVALVDYDWPDSGPIREGVVVAHSSSRAQLIEMTRNLKQAASLFTGEKPLDPVLLFAVDVDRKL